MLLITLVVGSFFVAACEALSSPSVSYYFAGVVEYAKIRNSSNPVGERDANLNEYIRLIYSREADNLDILVFPESCLNNLATAEFVPEVKENGKRVEGDGILLKELAKAARFRKMYLVVNLYEKSVCPDAQQIRFNDTRPCPSDGLNLYNTNLVFDNNGNLISKYRKYNLYGEVGVTQPLYPESIPFTTNFGVEFAQIICFDLLFQHPAMELVQNGIKDFIISKMWFSKAPFLTAVQMQEGWAYGNDVNLLAAGASEPTRGSTGSGIFHGKFGKITAVMNHLPERKIYRAVVPKKMTQKPLYGEVKTFEGPEMFNLFLKKDNSTPFVSESIPITSNGALNQTICMHTCCTFEISYRHTLTSSTSSSQLYQYRMIAYSGLRTYNEGPESQVPKREAVEICAVLACSDDTIESCSNRIQNAETGFIFDSLKISTNLPSDKNILVMPSSTNLSIMPYSVSDFDLTEEKNMKDDRRHVEMKLLTTKQDLFSFGIYARNFDQDA